MSGLEEQNGSTYSKQVKVLGMRWDCETDNLPFDFESLVEFGYSLKPTKRNLLRLTAKIFDPLGLLSPATFILKVLFQKVCLTKYGWDDALPGEHQKIWYQWLNDFEKVRCIRMPRYYFTGFEGEVNITTLHGFGYA